MNSWFEALAKKQLFYIGPYSRQSLKSQGVVSVIEVAIFIDIERLGPAVPVFFQFRGWLLDIAVSFLQAWPAAAVDWPSYSQKNW